MQTLRKRLTYDQMVSYIETNKETIKNPNRLATFFRNSPFLSKYDDESFLDLEEEEEINKKIRKIERRRDKKDI